MAMFYKDFEELKDMKFDGMIITGAPVETFDMRMLRIGKRLRGIFSWRKPT